MGKFEESAIAAIECTFGGAIQKIEIFGDLISPVVG